LPGATARWRGVREAADLFAGVQDSRSRSTRGCQGSITAGRILTPTLRRIGVGFAQLPDGSYMAALMFDDANDRRRRRAKWPVA